MTADLDRSLSVAAPPGGAATLPRQPGSPRSAASRGPRSSAEAAPLGAAASTGGAAQGGVEVRLRDVRLGYHTRGGFVTVLDGIDMDLAPGDRLAVVGESGCGKSTLLHALAGLLPPAAGTVESRGSAAYMFQNDLLLPWKSVLENAAFAAEMTARPRRAWWRAAGGREARRRARARAEVLLREFGLGDALHLYPHQLSGGMRQRVALARTLALGRGLILLDEPFGSLDALTRSDLGEWVSGVMERHPATWVLVTHDVDEAVRLADRVVVLGGRPGTIRGSVEAGVRAAGEIRSLLKDGRGG